MPSASRDDWETHLRQRGLLPGEPEAEARASPQQPERAHLRALFAHADRRWWRPYAFHVANERWNVRERNALRGCGISAGLPDVWLMLPRPPHPFAVLELKADHTGRPSPAQEVWLATLACCGAGVCRVVAGWPEAFDLLDSYAGERDPRDPPPPVPSLLAEAAAAMVRGPRLSARWPEGVGAGDGLARAAGGDPLP